MKNHPSGWFFKFIKFFRKKENFIILLFTTDNQCGIINIEGGEGNGLVHSDRKSDESCNITYHTNYGIHSTKDYSKHKREAKNFKGPQAQEVDAPQRGG